jgi:hypothetical protein
VSKLVVAVGLDDDDAANTEWLVDLLTAVTTPSDEPH